MYVSVIRRAKPAFFQEAGFYLGAQPGVDKVRDRERATKHPK
jgi:hypothetical protein